MFWKKSYLIASLVFGATALIGCERTTSNMSYDDLEAFSKEYQPVCEQAWSNDDYRLLYSKRKRLAVDSIQSECHRLVSKVYDSAVEAHRATGLAGVAALFISTQFRVMQGYANPESIPKLVTTDEDWIAWSQYYCKLLNLEASKLPRPEVINDFAYFHKSNQIRYFSTMNYVYQCEKFGIDLVKTTAEALNY